MATSRFERPRVEVETPEPPAHLVEHVVCDPRLTPEQALVCGIRAHVGSEVELRVSQHTTTVGDLARGILASGGFLRGRYVEFPGPDGAPLGEGYCIDNTHALRERYGTLLGFAVLDNHVYWHCFCLDDDDLSVVDPTWRRAGEAIYAASPGPGMGDELDCGAGERCCRKSP